MTLIKKKAKKTHKLNPSASDQPKYWSNDQSQENLFEDNSAKKIQMRIRPIT